MEENMKKIEEAFILIAQLIDLRTGNESQQVSDRMAIQEIFNPTTNL